MLCSGSFSQPPHVLLATICLQAQLLYHRTPWSFHRRSSRPTLFPGSYVKPTQASGSVPSLFKRKHSYEWWIDPTVNKSVVYWSKLPISLLTIFRSAVNGIFTIKYFVGMPEDAV